MAKIFSADSLVLIWLLFAVLSPLCYALFFSWALRSGQFSQPQRSAGLALDSYIPAGRPAGHPPQSGKEADDVSL